MRGKGKREKEKGKTTSLFIRVFKYFRNSSCISKMRSSEQEAFLFFFFDQIIISIICEMTLQIQKQNSVLVICFNAIVTQKSLFRREMRA